MSYAMRKPVYTICEQQRHRSACASRSLISAFVVHCLDRIIPLLAIAEISRPQLVSSAEQVSFSLTWSQIPKTGCLVTWLILKNYNKHKSYKNQAHATRNLYRSTVQSFVLVYGHVCKKLEIYEPGHEKMCLMSDANNKGADQPAHPRSLISAFVVRCLDSILSVDSMAEISRL